MFEARERMPPITRRMPNLAGKAGPRHAGEAVGQAAGETAWRGPAPLGDAGTAATKSPVKPMPVGKAPFTVGTRTLKNAPDGSSEDRKTVGAGESVFIGASRDALWSASGGSLKHVQAGVRSDFAMWVAPEAAGACTVTAKPRRGGAVAISFTVIAPETVMLGNHVGQTYASNRAGSGFVAEVTIKPFNVSFQAVEVREGVCPGVATGYYKHVLGWDQMPHKPAIPWLQIRHDHRVGRILALAHDTVGTVPPGTPPPFGDGSFQWEIPQMYRLIGSSGNGIEFCKLPQGQQMFGGQGLEVTMKGGVINARTPVFKIAVPDLFPQRNRP